MWQCHTYSFPDTPRLGLKLFGQTLAKIRSSLGVPCEVLGYLLTMYDQRERITLEVEKILRRNFGDAVLARPIRIYTRHKAAPSHRQTIFQFEGASSRGHQDYAWLAEEVDKRLGGKPARRPPERERSPRTTPASVIKARPAPAKRGPRREPAREQRP